MKGESVMKKLFVLVVISLMGTLAFAQEGSKIQVGLDYSYFRFNPENSGTLNSHSLNGGGGEIAYFFTSMIGIKGDFQGYGSLTTNFTRNGVIASASGNLFTYNVEPIIKFTHSRLQPFGEALFGGAHSNFYGNLCKEFTCISNNPSNNAFDFILGGGLDVSISPHVQFRPVEADFVLTRFGNGFTNGNQNQSNFRYQAGIVLRF